MSATVRPTEPAWQQHPCRRFRPTSLGQFGQPCRRHEHPPGERTPLCLLQSCLLCLHTHPTKRDCTPTTPTVPAHPSHQPPGRSDRAAFNPCHASMHTRPSPPIPVSTPKQHATPTTSAGHPPSHAPSFHPTRNHPDIPLQPSLPPPPRPTPHACKHPPSIHPPVALRTVPNVNGERWDGR